MRAAPHPEGTPRRPADQRTLLYPAAGQVRVLRATGANHCPVETGAVCVSCYPRLRASPVPCPGCGQPQVLTSLDEAGRAVCAACAGHGEKYLCRRCGQPADVLARGVCSRCALQQRVHELLGGPGHTTSLGPIREALLGAANPKSVLTWLGRSNSARILAALARHDGPLTHQLLDTFPRSHSRSQIRQALVHAGLLPPRQELIEDVGAWLDDLLGDVPLEHAQLVRPFARWMVLRRARNLLYGQPVSRIVQLRPEQLSRCHGQAYLVFDRHPVLIPPRLADLIDQLHATATPTAVLGGRGSPASWLFPGQVPGRHLSVNGLVRQLNTYGIQARIARSATLINLAADLPAAVLADLLSMHINTAVRWVKRARRDWASYLAARAEATHRPGQEYGRRRISALPGITDTASE